MKLTKAQDRCLASVAEGTVSRSFDVYDGYSWSYGEHRTPWRTSEYDAPTPIQDLQARHLIELSPTSRPYSGRQVNQYELTTAGRVAVDELKGGE